MEGDGDFVYSGFGGGGAGEVARLVVDDQAFGQAFGGEDPTRRGGFEAGERKGFRGDEADSTGEDTQRGILADGDAGGADGGGGVFEDI